jgi:hypothetical protein
MEGSVHYCAWEQDNYGFRVFVRNHGEWSAQGDTFEEAVAKLEEIIGAATGDGEVQLEFVEGKPGAPEPSDLAYVSVCGTICYGLERQPNLYEGGYCEACGNPIGARTRERRIVTQLPAGDAGLNIGWNPIFSESFISLLRPEERQQLDFLEIIPPRRSRRAFYELVGRSISEFVARRGASTSAGQCARCGYKSIYYVCNQQMVRYIPLEIFHQPLPLCLAAGRDGAMALCLQVCRWREMVGRSGARQMRSDPVFLLPEAEIDRSPHLRVFGS